MTWTEAFNFWKPHTFCIKEKILNFVAFMIQFINKLWFEDGDFINGTNSIISELRVHSSRCLADKYCLRITQSLDNLPGDAFIFGFNKHGDAKTLHGLSQLQNREKYRMNIKILSTNKCTLLLNI
jgi:hypothetical protein